MRQGFDTSASVAVLFNCHVSGKTKKTRNTFLAGDFALYGNAYHDIGRKDAGKNNAGRCFFAYRCRTYAFLRAAFLFPIIW